MTEGLSSKLDEIILSFATDEWRKTASVIAKTLRHCEDNNIRASDDVIADRMLMVEGNLTDWRHSEVRLSRQSGRW
jgi:hypothetical protein